MSIFIFLLLFWRICISQFYETEACAPLCETQSGQSVLPPSYDDLMAAEKAMLKKYTKTCTSTKCCEHTQMNRSNTEASASAGAVHVEESSTGHSMSYGGYAQPDAVSIPECPIGAQPFLCFSVIFEFFCACYKFLIKIHFIMVVLQLYGL